MCTAIARRSKGSRPLREGGLRRQRLRAPLSGFPPWFPLRAPEAKTGGVLSAPGPRILPHCQCAAGAGAQARGSSGRRRNQRTIQKRDAHNHDDKRHDAPKASPPESDPFRPDIAGIHDKSHGAFQLVSVMDGKSLLQPLPLTRVPERAEPRLPAAAISPPRRPAQRPHDVRWTVAGQEIAVRVIYRQSQCARSGLSGAALNREEQRSRPSRAHCAHPAQCSCPSTWCGAPDPRASYACGLIHQNK